MGKTNLIQADFLAGEISPRMEMQSNLEGRKHGVELMQNFFTHPQGSAETSWGFEWVSDIDGTSGRIFGFPVNLYTSFMVAIVDDTISVYNHTGPVPEFDQVQSGYFLVPGVDWAATEPDRSSVEFLPGAARLSSGYSGSGSPQIYQECVALLGVSYTLAIVVAYGNGLISLKVGGTAGTSGILDTTIQGPGVYKFTGLSSVSLRMHIYISLGAGEEDVTISEVHLFDPAGDFIEFTIAPPTRQYIETVQARMYPGEDAMILTASPKAPSKLSWTAGVWAHAAISFTSAPAWTIYYPTTCAFFGGRLWLGGVTGMNNRFWGSKSLDYDDFTVGALADDAIDMTIDKGGAIAWIAGGTSLLIGTDKAEHIVTSEGGVIIPEDKYTVVQSTNGSAQSQAVEVGNEIAFLSADRQKVRVIGFEWLKDAWRSRDLTYSCDHVSREGGGIIQLVYAANPDSTLIGVTRSGEMVVLTYETYTQTVGASRRVTDGKILSAGTASFGGVDEVWVLVDRGSGNLHLEKERHPGNVKLDSYLKFTGTGGTAPHLANRECQVVVDGAVHPNVTPDVDGVFETEYAGGEIYIGLKIDSIIRTLPVADDIANIGTTRSMRKRFSEIGVRIIESWPPKINGWRAPSRRPATPMGEVEPAKTENVVVSNSGWDQDAQITIEQDLPLRTEVAGWFGRIQQEEI